MHRARGSPEAHGKRGVVQIGCNCGGGNKTAKMLWVVDLANTGKTFPDGTARKTYALAGEANAAINALGLAGKIRPRPQAA